MPDARIDVSVSEDRKVARIELVSSRAQQASAELTLDQVTKLVASLGQARAAMVENLPVPSIDGVAINPIYVTQWAVQPEARTEGSVIAFQHPAFGPVGFVLNTHDAERVVRALSGHLAMVHSKETGSSKPS